MVVMLGSQVKVIEIPGNGEPPADQPTDNTQPGGQFPPSDLTGAVNEGFTPPPEESQPSDPPESP